MTDKLTRRDFAISMGGLGLALGLGRMSLLGQAKGTPVPAALPEAADYSLVDPELVPALQQFPAVEITPEMVKQSRKSKISKPLPAPAPKAVSRKIPGPTGAPKVKVWIVDPAPSQKNKPVLLHMHGGGFVMSDTMLLPRIQGIAKDCGCVVVSVEYRLAPETRYPGALQDNYAALKWVYANAAELGIDPTRIAIGGESAGGGHAAMLALYARDRKEVPIIFQLLIYPQLDDRTGSTKTPASGSGEFLWTVKDNQFGWSSLLGVPAGSASVPAGAVPARTADLAGLPPTWIGVGSIDLFVEEDKEYAKRLEAAGVPTKLVTVPGAYHGFDVLAPTAKISQQFTASWKSALRDAFAR
jgi:acetyl esterase/lipase